MGIFLVYLITAGRMILANAEEHPAVETYQVFCQQGETFACNSSLMLITNITNQLKEMDVSSFENLRRDCMGKALCDPRRVCEKSKSRPLTVHFLCVDKRYIRSSSCNNHPEKVTGDFGYIQSPDYPAGFFTDVSCSWTIDVPIEKAVIVILQDFVTTPRSRQDSCERTLVVSGASCQGDTKEETLLCRQVNITSLTRCGTTEIRFMPSRRRNEVRYWLSFCVLHRDQISTVSKSASHCPILSHDVNYGQGSTSTPGTNSQDSNTEVLIIMLSIVGGIAAVLLIILIVICVRCRQIQVSGAGSLYSDLSPSVQPHYEYVSTSDVEKVRPQLADGYFQVADALPFVQRVEPPTSPQYAEVEHAADLRKVLHTASSDQPPGGTKHKDKSGDTDIQNTEDSQRDNSCARSGSSSTKISSVLGTLKGSSIKTNYENIISNEDMQRISNCAEKAAISTNVPTSSPTVLNTLENNEHANCYTLGKSPPVKQNLQTNKRKHSDSGGLPSDLHQRNCSATEGGSKRLQVVSDKANSNHNLAGDNHSTNLPQTTDHTYFVLEKRKQSACIRKGKSTDMRARSKSLPSQNSAISESSSEVKKKHSAAMDIPTSRGIVRNGIMKFEQNSA